MKPRSRIRRTVTYKVVWHVKAITFPYLHSGPNDIKAEFAVVRTVDAALKAMVRFGMPMVRRGPAPEGFLREKHCGTAKTKPGFFWRTQDKFITITATPYRVE